MQRELRKSQAAAQGLVVVLAELEEWLDLVILGVFSHLNNSRVQQNPGELLSLARALHISTMLPHGVFLLPVLADKLFFLLNNVDSSSEGKTVPQPLHDQIQHHSKPRYFLGPAASVRELLQHLSSWEL